MTLYLNGTTGVSGVDGSAGTPSLQGNDTNTGIVFGTDTVGVSTGGVQRTTVDNSGRLLVGVGSANANGGVLQLSGGITFPGTQVGASDVNTLDDYEEGTWTPVISDGTNNATMNSGGGISRYTKIGNQVACVVFVATTSLGSVSGAIRVTGLPFTNGAQYCTVTCGWAENLNITAGRVLGGWIPQNNNFITLTIWSSATGTASLTATEWSADGGAMFTFSYLT